jgi:glycosyltransferase involved in cell wall biosynthesis
MTQLKIKYIALEPSRYPRIPKIAKTLANYGDVKFEVMQPRVRLVWRRSRLSRLLASFINYSAIVVQILFTSADLYWVANCPDLLALPLIIARRRYILEYRSPWALEIETDFGTGPWVTVALLLERLSIRYSFAVTLTTSRLLPRVSSYLKPTYVIPNYPLRSFGESVRERNAFRKSLGYSDEDRIVLFVGKLSRVEGADILAGVIKDVLERDGRATFWVVGDGPLYPELRRLERTYPRRLKLFGWLPNSEVPSIINACDVCIAPRHSTPFSSYYNHEGVTKISEYMYFEKPIVACGISESENYILVDEHEMAEEVLRVLGGSHLKPHRLTWEESSEEVLRELLVDVRKRLNQRKGD